ncbi:MAG: hypothetical protein GY750_03970 [Lentisphaerae bacterium]|nr:hypothetical protein [Lentisphaerota bacterium]MCP4100570.1 hypothetical protein [Lentisphaerota bacterium]
MQKTTLMATGVALALSLFCGCRTEDQYRKDRAEFAIRHFERIQKKVIPKGKIFSLPDCVKVAFQLSSFPNAGTPDGLSGSRYHSEKD